MNHKEYMDIEHSITQQQLCEWADQIREDVDQKIRKEYEDKFYGKFQDCMIGEGYEPDPTIEGPTNLEIVARKESNISAIVLIVSGVIAALVSILIYEGVMSYITG